MTLEAAPAGRAWMLALALLLPLWDTAPAIAGHPNALWHVVHGLCLRDARLIGRPAPCLLVNRREGFAVVPDLEHKTQVLLVPTVRVTGIESPALLEAGGVNYWQAAWEARRFVEKRAGRPIPRDLIGLAINSVSSRSQSQLHIHVDCIGAATRRVLMAHERRIGFIWTPLGQPLAGQRFKVRRLEGEDLGEHDPFKLLARGVGEARARMANQTLVVVGATFSSGSPGFFLLSSGDGAGFGEGLLDHRCLALRDP